MDNNSINYRIPTENTAGQALPAPQQDGQPLYVANSGYMPTTVYAEQKVSTSGTGVAGFALGLIGLLTSWAIIGLIPALIGLVLGCCEKKNNGKSGLNTAGIVLNIAAIVVSAIIILLLVSFASCFTLIANSY